MQKYECPCGYVYDPEQGDPDNGVAPGTPWENVPEDWVCPAVSYTHLVIPVFGVDATDAAKELIANKQMTGSIKQDAEGMADAVATITANMIEGKYKFEGLNENYEVVDGWTVNIPYSIYTGE